MLECHRRVLVRMGHCAGMDCQGTNYIIKSSMDLDDLAIVVAAPLPVPAAFPPCSALTRLLLATVAPAHAALADGAILPSLSPYPWPTWSAHRTPPLLASTT
jgi:hypothetical protein